MNIRIYLGRITWNIFHYILTSVADISGMRDKLIHGYFGVDIDAVWDTIQNDIPKLKNGVKKILKNL